jgi:DNA helicase IV
MTPDDRMADSKAARNGPGTWTKGLAGSMKVDGDRAHGSGVDAPDLVAEEQRHVDAAYARLAEFTAHVRSRMDGISRSPGTGTAQDLLEKQALFDNLTQQLSSATAAENRLCFGRVDHEDGRVQHIGRIGLRDDDGEPILIDWRAPNAAGFYQATSVQPMGLRRRRRIITRGRTVTHVEDEDLADPTAIAVDAAARAIDAPREGRMGDIIATIAGDQDRIVRSPLGQVTVVQGGPGTGKTVVALHRAAWLLYTYRERLAKDGVLVVGPSNAFLRYIDQVLPSLGETDVVLLTPGQLHPGVSTSLSDRPDTAAVKGDLAMARVIAAAVRQRIRIPDHDVAIELENGATVHITAHQLADARRGVPRHATFHGGREPFLKRALEALCRQRARALGDDPSDVEVREAILADLVDDANVRRTLNLMWLPITPERLVSRLLSDPDVLAAAAAGVLSAAQQRLLLRPADSPWTIDDVPLLDEAAERLGEFAPAERTRSRAEEGYAELHVVDPLARNRPTSTVAERAMNDRGWIYGHVVVDEAQELSRMAWRALSRRCTRRSMTVVGDLQQTTHPAGARSWQDALSWAGDRLDLHTLTVTYRITRQTAATAAELLQRAGGSAPELLPIRDGTPTEQLSATVSTLADLILERAGHDAGRIGVVVPDSDAATLMATLARADRRFGVGDDAIDAPISVLTARDTKGLEFDHVFVVSPERIATQAARGSDIYVACTRATQTLHLVRL